MGDRNLAGDGGGGVKATTTATRDKNKFKVPYENRKAVRCRNPVLWKQIRKTRKARREFDARVGTLCRDQLVAGRANEDMQE